MESKTVGEAWETDWEGLKGNVLCLEICLGWIDQSQAWLCSKLMGISEVWLGYTIMTGYGTKMYWGEVSWEDL